MHQGRPRPRHRCVLQVEAGDSPRIFLVLHTSSWGVSAVPSCLLIRVTDRIPRPASLAPASLLQAPSWTTRTMEAGAHCPTPTSGAHNACHANTAALPCRPQSCTAPQPGQAGTRAPAGRRAPPTRTSRPRRAARRRMLATPRPGRQAEEGREERKKKPQRPKPQKPQKAKPAGEGGEEEPGYRCGSGWVGGAACARVPVAAHSIGRCCRV